MDTHHQIAFPIRKVLYVYMYVYISYTGTCWNFRDPLSFWKAHAYREWGVVYIQSIHFTSGRAVELA